jgi:pimeloyl-ACP methyl ester carboxylesterase
VETVDLLPACGGLEQTWLSDYVGQVLARIRGDEAPILMGASLGGLLALKVAESRPVRALVVINSVPPAGTAGWPLKHPPFPPIVRWSQTATLAGTRDAMPTADAATVRWAHYHWRDESGAVLNEVYAGVPVMGVEAPVLVIVGEADREIPPGLGVALAARLEAKVVRVPRAGHVDVLLGPHGPPLAEKVFDWLETETRVG